MELRCDNIQYSIEGSRILNGISLGVSNNEFHTILGPNGCGKTTFLKTVYRITKPDLGTIYLDGKPLDNISIRKSAQNMAVVAQFNNLNFDCSVLDVVMPLLPNTLILGILAYAVVFALAIVLAVICAANEDNWIDRIICKIGTTLYYTPTFWFGIILVLVFSITLKWFPSSGAYDMGQSGNILNRMWHLILPLIVMVASHLWYYAYMIRNKFLDEVRKDYVLLARSKGLSKRKILWKHCLRNVLPTIVSIMAVSVPHVTGGTVTVEAVFNYAGIGNLAVESAKYHDYNLLMIDVLITGFIVFLSSFVAQTVNEEIDPRMKDSEVRVW